MEVGVVVDVSVGVRVGVKVAGRGGPDVAVGSGVAVGAGVFACRRQPKIIQIKANKTATSLQTEPEYDSEF